MMPQLTAQQVEAALRSISARIDAKKLEIDSLNSLRALAPGFLGPLVPPNSDPDTRAVVTDAVNNYMTAKINQALMDLEQFILQKAMFEAQQRQVQLASGVLPNNRRPQG